MSRKLMLAVGIQVLVMGLVLVQPLLVRATGTIVFLETEKMDPRSLFRGDYVILGYTLAQNILPADQASEAAGKFTPVYVTVSTERPASFVAVGFEPPQLKPDQACIVGRSRGQGSVDFPQIAQYFVPEGTGHAIESARGKDLLAKVATSDNCKAVLLGLEPR
ncbi:MAG: GDYXXLXY domain-containing protein [Gammaproteobacteria bacterium]|nr:GDYXXLXY domain-containing protein [Gammaproteobacteria bacterium]MCP5416367.1 GDYXXLXY domain-containing protein [Chromatiaceae bacterium]